MGILNHLNILVSANLLQAVILIGVLTGVAMIVRGDYWRPHAKNIRCDSYHFYGTVLVFVWFFPTFGQNLIAVWMKTLFFWYGQRFPEFQCFTFFCISIVPYPIE